MLLLLLLLLVVVVVSVGDYLTTVPTFWCKVPLLCNVPPALSLTHRACVHTARYTAAFQKALCVYVQLCVALVACAPGNKRPMVNQMVTRMQRLGEPNFKFRCRCAAAIFGSGRESQHEISRQGTYSLRELQR